MEKIEVTGQIGANHYKTELNNGRGMLIADEPIEEGGQDLGFAPTELLNAALASCTAITLRMYADRKGWKLEDIKVRVSLVRNKETNETEIQRDVELIGDLSEEERKRMMLIADKCPVHHILTHKINVQTVVSEQ